MAISEEAHGVQLKGSFVPELGYNPAGLSRLGRFAASLENDAARKFWTRVVGFLELIPRGVLGGIDEGLKQGAYLNELSSNLLGSLEANFGVALVDASRMAGLEDDVLFELHAVFANRILKEGGNINYKAMAEEVNNILKRAGIEETDEVTLRRIVSETHDTATQFSRNITVTQDPTALAGAARAANSSDLVRMVSPFTRAMLNGFFMVVERVPVVNLLLPGVRHGITGKLGAREQFRSIGKNATGLSLISLGAIFKSDEKDTNGFKIVDKGSYKEFVLQLPNDTRILSELESFYSENTQYVDDMIARFRDHHQLDPNTQIDPIEFLYSTLNISEDGNSIELSFRRFNIVNGLLEIGVILSDVVEIFQEKEEYEFTDDDRSRFAEVSEKLAAYAYEEGPAKIIEDLSNMAAFASGGEKSVYIGQEFLRRYLSDFMSPFGGLYRGRTTMGSRVEAATDEDFLTRAFYDSMLRPLQALLAGDVRLRRNWLGEVETGRKGHTFLYGAFPLDTKATNSPIDRELARNDMRKLSPKPNMVPGLPNIPLTKFTVVEETLDESSKAILDQLDLPYDANAYDIWLVSKGAMPHPELGGMTPREFLMSYFQSDTYKEDRAKIDAYENRADNLSQAKLRELYLEAEEAKAKISARVDKADALGSEQATKLMLNRFLTLLVDGKGRSLYAVQSAHFGTQRQIKGRPKIQDRESEVQRLMDLLKEGE